MQVGCQVSVCAVRSRVALGPMGPNIQLVIYLTTLTVAKSIAG